MTMTPPVRVGHLALVVLLTLTVAGARAEDWPQFRGPTGQGIATSKNVPVECATKNVAWRIDIPGRGWSSPVLSAGRLYLTTATGENAGDGSGAGDTSLRALCIDAASGKVIWDIEVFHRVRADMPAMHPKNSQASPTPIVDGDRLYVHFGHLGTAALDLAGNVLWRQTIQYRAAHGNGGSPVLVDGLLIFNCDGVQDPFIAALDAKSGEVKWKTLRHSPAKKQFSVATPLAIRLDAGATQIISPASGFVGAYDAKDGREIWRVRYGEGYSVVPQPAFAQGVIVLSSGYDSPVTYAIKPAGATGDVTKTNVVWTSRKAVPLTPSPLILGDELFMISDGGIATCSDVKTGKVHWSQRLDGEFSASPVVAEGRVYFQNEAGVGYVVSASTKYQPLAENDLAEPTLASYAVTDGALFIRTAKHLYRIGR